MFAWGRHWFAVILLSSRIPTIHKLQGRLQGYTLQWQLHYDPNLQGQLGLFGCLPRGIH